jgi:hypothetical protein
LFHSLSLKVYGRKQMAREVGAESARPGAGRCGPATCRRTASEEFTAACDAVPELDTGGALTELRELLKDHLRQRAYPGWFLRWPDMEAAAKTLRWFELVAVPGLLQTEDYARAVLRTQVIATDDEIDEMVKGRLDRQAVLTRDSPPMLWVILDEGVLRRPVGGKYVMREQLDRLAEDTDDIAAVTVMWDTLKSEALSRSASLELVEEVAKTWT